MAEPEPGGERNEQRSRELEFRARQFSRDNLAPVETLANSHNPDQLIDAARTLADLYTEQPYHRDGPLSDYRYEDAISGVASRSASMELSFRDLVALGYVNLSTFDQRTTEADFSNPALAFDSATKLKAQGRRVILDQEGKPLRVEVEEAPTQVFLVGTDAQRKKLSEDLKVIQAELTARKDFGIMLRWLQNHTENLGGLVQFYLMGALTPESMDVLCNAKGRKGRASTERGEVVSEGLTRTAGGGELRKDHEYGDAISAALQCLEIAAVSENVDELKDLLLRPGRKFLFGDGISDQEVEDIFLTEQQRNNRPLNPILVRWIGEPAKWSNTIDRPKANVKREGTSRGLLTNHGNILVESDWNDAKDIFNQIDRFLGGGDGSSTLARRDAKSARSVAWGFMRIFGMASELGKQKYKQICVDGVEREIMSHDLGGMTSDDRVKVYLINVFRDVYRYLKPEIRNFGPGGSLGKYPDRLTVSYFKQWTDKLPYGKRTFQEMRWGYRKDRVRDAVTGAVVELPEEEPYRVGQLPWREQHPKTFNQVALGPYIAGREKVGIFEYIKRSDYDVHELMDSGFAKSLANWLGIAMNEQTVFDGKLRGIYNGESNVQGTGHDDRVKGLIKTHIREYKKQFVRAWWDGVRSLPQFRQWCAMPPQPVKNKDKAGEHDLERAIDLVIRRLGEVEILTPEEAQKLPKEAII